MQSDFDKYQMEAMSFRLESADSQYALLNLAAEAGEVLSLKAKLIRDGVPVEEGTADWEGHYEGIKKELGDVLWHVAAIAADHGFDLSTIARGNIKKLTDRARRNQLQGSGDNR